MTKQNDDKFATLIDVFEMQELIDIKINEVKKNLEIEHQKEMQTTLKDIYNDALDNSKQIGNQSYVSMNYLRRVLK